MKNKLAHKRNMKCVKKNKNDSFNRKFKQLKLKKKIGSQEKYEQNNHKNH